jgi:hypothetical protein
VFRSTERHAPLSWVTIKHNAITGARELLLLGPLAALAWKTLKGGWGR